MGKATVMVALRSARPVVPEVPRGMEAGGGSEQSTNLLPSTDDIHLVYEHTRYCLLNTHTHIYIYNYLYIYVYVCMNMYVCVYVCYTCIHKTSLSIYMYLYKLPCHV